MGKKLALQLKHADGTFYQLWAITQKDAGGWGAGITDSNDNTVWSIKVFKSKREAMDYAEKHVTVEMQNGSLLVTFEGHSF